MGKYSCTVLARGGRHRLDGVVDPREEGDHAVVESLDCPSLLAIFSPGVQDSPDDECNQQHKRHRRDRLDGAPAMNGDEVAFGSSSRRGQRSPRLDGPLVLS